MNILLYFTVCSETIDHNFCHGPPGYGRVPREYVRHQKYTSLTALTWLCSLLQACVCLVAMEWQQPTVSITMGHALLEMSTQALTSGAVQFAQA